MAEETLQIFPVTQFDVRVVPADGLLLLQVHCLPGEGARLEDAIPSAWFALKANQAAKLAESLQRTVKTLDETGPQH